MIKTYRLKNLLMAGQITGPELEALLQKKDYLGALYDLRNDRVWMADIVQNPMAMAAVLASETAMAAVLASETAMAVVAASETAMAAVLASETAMAAVAASETAMAAVLASETALAAVLASETALAAVLASETAMAAVLASETALAAVVASETAMAAVNNSSIAKNVFFKSPKKRTVSVGDNTWIWQNIVNGRGVFVRYQGTAHNNNKLKVDNTKEIAVVGADFFKIIPYTSNLQIYRYHTGATVHYIPFGA